MKKQKISLILALALGANMLNAPIQALAVEMQHSKGEIISKNQNNTEDAKIIVQSTASKEEKAKTKKFNYFGYTQYNDMFKMSNTNIKSIKTNGGHYAGQKIEYAIDDNVNTYWETKSSNSQTFNNQVEIEFKERETIDRIVYGARPSDTKGFAEEFEIYSSNTTSGETFTLLTTGRHNRVSGLVEGKFTPTEMKRIRFKFKKSNQNWATLNEIAFYKQDKLSEEIEGIFTNGLQMELKEGYDLKKLEELEGKILNHPLAEELQTILNYGKKILNNEVQLQGTYFNIERRGNSIAESQKRKVWNFQDWQPTGYRVIPGDVIDVYVDIEDGEPLPNLIFKQMDTAHNGTTSLSLHKGKNTITIPEVEVDSIRPGKHPGGVLYIVNPFTESDQSREPKIRFENLKKYPNFVKGVDNDQEVLKELEEYVEEIRKDNKIPDVFEVFGDKSLINVSATAALDFYKTTGKTPSYSADAQDKIIRDTMEFWGFDNSAEIHSDFNFRYVNMVKNLNGGAYMNANNGITGMRPEHESGALDGSTSWGFAHEMGHNFDTRNRLIVEVTNNILALHQQRILGIPSRLTSSNIFEERVYPKVIREDYENNVMYPDNYMDFQHIATLWQLAVYDEDFNAKLEKMFRETSEGFSGENAVHNGWAKFSSDIFKMDMTEHFERHGAKITKETKDYTSKYPKLNKKTWYINDSIYLEKGGEFSSKLKYEISDVKYGNGEVKLSFTMDEENKKNRLGYEVYRDGNLIAFTEKSEYIDKNITEGVNHEYKIVAYDKTISPVGESKIMAFAPRITMVDKVTLKLSEEVKPLEYVKGFNYLGEELNDGIEFTHNIDNKKAGEYFIEYTLKDGEATTTKRIDVLVVSDYKYLSDYEWESVETEYGTPRRNSNIKARVLGDIKEFEKGIGIHANGKVVYDLSNMEYDKFEAILGVDMNLSPQNNSSISFRILGDGVELAKTGVLRHGDNGVYVSVPVKGVSNLTIEILNGGNGNTSDHGIIANPILTTNNGKPTMNIPKSQTTKLGLPIENIIGEYSAFDPEDGDITSKVSVSGEVNFNKAGSYDVTYSVKDSSGNEEVSKRSIKVVDMDNSDYVSDLNWKSANVGYGSIQKDKSVSGGSIRLTGEDGQEKVYDKGLGIHATSTVVYDLTGKDYGYFTSYVGVDRAMYGRVGSVSFEVWLDNVKVYDSGVMQSRDPQKFVEVKIEGAKELKLVVTDGGNGIGSDHGSFGDTKLHFADKNSVEVSRGEFDSLIKEVDSINRDHYTVESVNALYEIRRGALESIKDGYNQVEIDSLVKSLKDGISSLVEIVDYEGLEEKVNKGKEFKEYIYTKESYGPLKELLIIGEEILAERNSSRVYVLELMESIEKSCGALRVVKGEGSISIGKDELELMVIEGDKITDKNMFPGSEEEKQLLWNDFVENLFYAKEVLYDVDAISQEVTSVGLFLKGSLEKVIK